MEAAKVKSSTRKIVNMLMILMVVAGAIAFTVMSTTPHADGELMSRMFLIFFGVIITVQIIPGLLLFGVMLKEVCGFGRKAEVRK
jgi:membrane protein YdbS with pleckstrin-like domain